MSVLFSMEDKQVGRRTTLKPGSSMVFVWTTSSLIFILSFIVSSFLFPRELGTSSRFADKSSKLLLLDFAVCHCPAEEMAAVIAERRLLQTRLTYEECFGLSERGGLIGRGSVAVQQIFSMGTGAMQQLMGQR